MKTIQLKSKKNLSIMAVLFMVLFGIMAKGCGGGGSSSSTTPTTPTVPTIEAPGAPVLTITSEIGKGMVTSTLTWTAPTTGGEATSYEIYRTTTAPTAENPVFQPDNHVISLSAATFEFIENAGMEELVTTYWVVTAKNAGGETASNVVEYTPPGSGEVEGYGNNFAAAMIFADGYGISGDPINGTWMENNVSDFNTGFRPSETQMAALTVFPYFDVDTTYELDGVTYYKQQTVSTWQGEWKNGLGEEQNVTAKWGDNLISQNLTIDKPVRIEMVLTKALDTNMTAYNMRSLYGTMRNEIYGADTTTKTVDTAFVFAANAHLTIQKVDDNGSLYDPLYDQDLWQGDGPGNFGAEVNVAGNFTYGFVWLLQDENVPYGKAGTWRITFTLSDLSPVNTANNTSIISAPNSTDYNSTSAYIDIQIAQ